MSVVDDTIRELLIGHLESQGFNRTWAQDFLGKNAPSVQADIDQVNSTQTALDQLT